MFRNPKHYFILQIVFVLLSAVDTLSPSVQSIDNDNLLEYVSSLILVIIGVDFKISFL